MRETVKHIDRCLSCLSCMTTCPSGVNYMHLVDHARAHIAKTYKRPWMDRLMRTMLGLILPYPTRFGLALRAARLAKPFAALAPKRFKPDAGDGADARLPARRATATSRPFMPRDGREKAARRACSPAARSACSIPAINEATIRVLTRLGAEVVVVDGVGCCGALQHHMGQEDASHAMAAAQRPRLHAREARARGLDHVVINTSGCGTTFKDYGFMLREDRRTRRGCRGGLGDVARRQRGLEPSLLARPAARAGLRECASCASPIIRPARCSTASA